MGLDKFSTALDLLKGYHVNLYVGEDVYKGKLLGVEIDHVVLETTDNYIFYYNIDKIQAITKNTRQFKPDESAINFLKTQSLTELLKSFHHSWVTILSINKQKFSGVLSDIDEDYATLINGEERILIKLTHVSNILKGFIKEENKAKDLQPKGAKPKDSASLESKSEKSNSKESKDESHDNDDSKKNENENEKETKGKETVDCQTPKEYTAEKLPDSNLRSSFKVTSTITELKVKDNSDCEKCDKDELHHTEPEPMVWSQPIKAEVHLSKSIDEDTHQNKKHQSEETMQKAKGEQKNPTREMNKKEKKSEEHVTSKPKHSDHSEETNAGKADEMEIKSIVINKEGKAAKSKEIAQESKPVISQEAALKKSENTSKSYTNDTNSVWKQKDQEQRAFRFTGEPVPPNRERTFPFAGWPSKSKRTFKF